MSRRVAVVTPTYGNSWSEEDVVCRRLAGALATTADVDVVVPAGGAVRVEHDGAVRVLRLPAFPQAPGHREAVLQSLLGPVDHPSAMSCECLVAKAEHLVEDLPSFAQDALVQAGGGDSPALWRHLAESSYDVVVFAGYATASTVYGVRHVDERSRVVLLPLARHGRFLRMALLDELFERIDCVVVTTETERAVVERHRAGHSPVWNAGFVLRVNPMVCSAPPHGFRERLKTIVVPADWHASDAHRLVKRLVGAVPEALGPDVELRIVGPGAETMLQRGGEHLSSSRLDVWRWMSRSVAVVDLQRNRLLGRDVIESMMFGTPVVVPAEGGASREHAQLSNGGLWYRTEAELLACLGALLDPDTRRSLSEEGRDYAVDAFTDTDRYVKAVVKAVLEEG